MRTSPASVVQGSGRFTLLPFGAGVPALALGLGLQPAAAKAQSSHNGGNALSNQLGKAGDLLKCHPPGAGNGDTSSNLVQQLQGQPQTPIRADLAPLFAEGQQPLEQVFVEHVERQVLETSRPLCKRIGECKEKTPVFANSGRGNMIRI